MPTEFDLDVNLNDQKPLKVELSIDNNVLLLGVFAVVALVAYKKKGG